MIEVSYGPTRRRVGDLIFDEHEFFFCGGLHHVVCYQKRGMPNACLNFEFRTRRS